MNFCSCMFYFYKQLFFIEFLSKNTHATSDCIRASSSSVWPKKSKSDCRKKWKLSHHLLFNELSHSGGTFGVYIHNQFSNNNSMMMLQAVQKFLPKPKNKSCDDHITKIYVISDLIIIFIFRKENFKFS